MAEMRTLTINGTRFTLVAPVPVATIALLSDAWVGTSSPYSQVVALVGITPTSKVDLQPTAEQLEIFRQKELAFTTVNDNGVVTVYAIGDKPKRDYTIQVTVSEVG